MLAANDNAAPAARLVPIVGWVTDDGQVTLSGAWRPSPAVEILDFPNDPREA